MPTLIQVRDTIALHGRIEFNYLCREVAGTPALVQAMLDRLIQMGIIEKIESSDNGCINGRCRTCPESQSGCKTIIYSLKNVIIQS